MVRMTVLASGSKGNSTIVASATTRILVDAGLSCRELMKRMKAAGEEPSALNAILVTHEHQDHVQGMAVTARKLGIPGVSDRADAPRLGALDDSAEANHLCAVAGAAQGSERQRTADSGQRTGKPAGGRWQETGDRARRGRQRSEDGERALLGGCSPAEPDEEEKAAAEEVLSEPEKDPTSLPSVEYFRSGSGFRIGDIAVTPFTIPHDAADPVGFVFEADGVRIAIATDLGYMPSNVHVHLRRADVLMLESNHDVDMLRDGPYPWSVKQRVMSRVGHLSNDAAAEFLARAYDGGAAYVVLAHLSENNNLPELARISAERALRDRMSLLANHLLLAEQDRPLEAIVL